MQISFSVVFSALCVMGLLLGALLLLWAAYWEPRMIQEREYNWSVGADLKAWQGLKIAVISDLHAGAPYIDEQKIKKIVAMTMAASPDLILLPGDFTITHVLGGKKMPINKLAKLLGKLRAPLGVYAVLGNHDYFNNPKDIIAHFEAEGIRFIDDQTVTLQNTEDILYLTGLSDAHMGEKDYHKAVADLAPHHVSLCVSHSPLAFFKAPLQCRYMVAGDHHGGQVLLPFLGAVAVPKMADMHLVRGIYKKDGRQIFVSSGVGTTGLPVRFRVPPEISILNLK